MVLLSASIIRFSGRRSGQGAGKQKIKLGCSEKKADMHRGTIFTPFIKTRNCLASPPAKVFWEAFKAPFAGLDFTCFEI